MSKKADVQSGFGAGRYPSANFFDCRIIAGLSQQLLGDNHAMHHWPQSPRLYRRVSLPHPVQTFAVTSQAVSVSKFGELLGELAILDHPALS